MPRPGALGRRSSSATHTVDERRTRRARREQRLHELAQRAYLLQCERCNAVATGRYTYRGVLVSNGMRVEYEHHTKCANGKRCGGKVRLIDIARNETP